MAKKRKNKTTTGRGKTFLDSVTVIVLALVVIGSLGAFFLLNHILKDADFIDENLTTIQASDVRDDQGEVIKEISPGDGLRESVEFDRVPQVVIDAFLSVEDSRFYKHNGFDLPRLLKSALNNLKAGSLDQGGSTLTMQVIDRTHHTTSEDQSSIDKIYGKIKEIFIAIKYDSVASKDEIILQYLNLINFGGPARGIQKASEYYFGKDVENLNLSEAAFLAGVVNAPNSYNPYYNYELAKQRRDQSLVYMRNHGYISEEEFNLALSTELAFQLNGEVNFESSPYLSYLMYVEKEARELYGLDIYKGNLEIHTSMNREAQEYADYLMNSGGVKFPEGDDKMQAGFTLVDNETLGIVAIGGGRNFDGEPEETGYVYNYGTEERKPTGSAIKPILEYTLAFDYLGWSTGDYLPDVPMYYRGTKLQLYNADTKYRGDVSFADAVSYSWNTTAIYALEKVVDQIGLDKYLEIVKKTGFKALTDLKDSSEFEFTMGIGGGKMMASPLEMAGAFAILPNGGTYTKPHAITKIVFKDGSQPDIVPSFESERVYSEQASYLMTTLLEGAVRNYSGWLQAILKSPYQVAAKTGTSDWGKAGLQWGIPETAMKDKWICAYTSDYTIAAWAGYRVGGPDAYFNNYKMNVNVPGQIDKKMLDFMHRDKYPANFSKPSGIVNISFIKGIVDGGQHYMPTDGTPKDLIGSGLVKKEFANLKTLSPEDIQNLASFNATINEQTKQIDFQFAPYPDAEALKEFDGLYHLEDFPNWKGKKLFSKSAVFGPIVYNVEIKQNGITLGAFEAGQTGSDAFGIQPGMPAEVCGYYSYKNNKASKSNTVCVAFSAEETQKLATVDVPEVPEVPVLPENGKDENNPEDPTDE